MNSKQVTPDWSKAPKWAKFWAMEANGTARWYERKPRPFMAWPDVPKFGWVSGGREKRADMPSDDWVSSLQERPVAKEEGLAETVLPDEKYERN